MIIPLLIIVVLVRVIAPSSVSSPLLEASHRLLSSAASTSTTSTSAASFDWSPLRALDWSPVSSVLLSVGEWAASLSAASLSSATATTKASFLSLFSEVFGFLEFAEQNLRVHFEPFESFPKLLETDIVLGGNCCDGA